MQKALIVSPHLDDAIFSLGGFILNNCVFRLTVLNVFTVSRYTVAAVGDPQQVTATRLLEESEASRRLNFASLICELPDASLRSQYRDEVDYLNVEVDPKNDDLWDAAQATVERVIASDDYSLLFFPLALGHQIDHRIVFEIGKKLLSQGLPVLFYEDAGYDAASQEDSINKHVACSGLDISRLRFEYIYPEAKLEYVKLYRTQVDENVLTKIAATVKRQRGETIWAEDKLIKELLLMGRYSPQTYQLHQRVNPSTSQQNGNQE